MTSKRKISRRAAKIDHQSPIQTRSQTRRSLMNKTEDDEDMKVPEILIEPEKGLGYIRFVVTDDALTFDKASKLLTKFQTLKPIVTKDSSVHISEKKTTIDARTCSQVTMDVMDQINVIIIKDLPACNYVVTNRPIGGPPLPPLA